MADVPVTSYERRIVTVLFADLVGFTPLGERLDPEDVAAIQDRYFATIREAVGRYGGSLEKFIGDAAMAAFGVPRTRDDDAERAVRTGLALASAVGRLGAEIGLDPGELAIRVGIATGEVVYAASGPDAGRLTGDTVNTAARLQTAAPPGGILVDEATSLRVTDGIELGALEDHELKGKAALVRAALAVAPRPARSRELAMGRLRAPTLGRDAEVARLLGAWRRVLASGESERWLVIAPPGVGKTRVLAEAVSGLVRLGTHVTQVRVGPDDGDPFRPVVELVAAAISGPAAGLDRSAIHAVIGPADLRDLLRDRLGGAGVVPERAAVVARALRALVEGSDAADHHGQDRAGLFDAWLEGLDALVGHAPTAWVIEDLHWAGADLLAFFEAAAARGGAPGTRLVVASARPSLLDRAAGWGAMDPVAGRHVLDLPTLAPLDASALVEALVGGAVDDELAARIAERSDGNPLFIEELLRTWVSVGVLTEDASGSFRLEVAPADLPLPTSVQAVYAAQLDDLPPPARSVARLGSVAGRRIPVRALPALGAADSDQGIAGLLRRSLVSDPHDVDIAGPGLVYRHALLRDAGYASLARAERALLHVRMARWLEAAAGERAAQAAWAIAAQWSLALDSVPALQRMVADDLDRDACRRLAAAWHERAGDASLRGGAIATAIAAYARATALEPDAPILVAARRLERLGEANRIGGEQEAAADAYDGALSRYVSALTSALGDEHAASTARTGIATASVGLSNVRYAQIRFADALAAARSGLERIGPADDAETVRLEIAREMAEVAVSNDLVPVALEAADTLERARRLGDPLLRLDAMRNAVYLRGEAGMGGDEELHELAVEAERLGAMDIAAGAYLNAGAAAAESDPVGAVALLARAAAAATALGRRETLGFVAMSRCEIGLLSGDWDPAVAAGLEGIGIAEQHGYDRVGIRTWNALTPIVHARGDRAVLAHCAQWLRARQGRFPRSPYGLVIHAAIDLRLASAGLDGPFVPDLDELLPGLALPYDDPSWLAAIESLVGYWLDAGDVGAARAAFDVAEMAPARASSTTRLWRASFCLLAAKLAAAEGDADAGVVLARSALATAHDLPAPWWHARTFRLLERLGAASAEELEAASDLERRLGVPSPAVP